MRTLYITVESHRPHDGIQRLHAADVRSARLAGANAREWSFECKMEDLGWSEGETIYQIYLNIGWLLGVIGVPKHAVTRFTIGEDAS